MEWVNRVQSIVFSRVKKETIEKLETKYPDINFTTSEKSMTTPRFPTIVIKQIDSLERGQDLNGNLINAGLFSFQIDVVDNKTQSRANEIMYEVLNGMKKMRFTIVTMPISSITDGVYRSTARCRRLIGSGDIL